MTGQDSKYSAAYRAIATSTKYLNAVRREWSKVEESWSQARGSIKALGDRPLVVLLATRENLMNKSSEEIEKEAVIRKLEMELAKRSTQGKLIVVENSGHHIQHDRPEVVVGAVREVVEAVRRKTKGV